MAQCELFMLTRGAAGVLCFGGIALLKGKHPGINIQHAQINAQSEPVRVLQSIIELLALTGGCFSVANYNFSHWVAEVLYAVHVLYQLNLIQTSFTTRCRL